MGCGPKPLKPWPPAAAATGDAAACFVVAAALLLLLGWAAAPLPDVLGTECKAKCTRSREATGPQAAAGWPQPQPRDSTRCIAPHQVFRNSNAERRG